MLGIKWEKAEAVSDEDLVVANNPIGILEVLRDYGTEEWGALFIFLPVPTEAADADAQAWLKIVKCLGIVNGGPWRVDAEGRRHWLEKTHPKLYRSDPLKFDVYRLDRSKLGRVIERLI